MKNLDLLVPRFSTAVEDSFSWATVTDDSPLRIRLDGDTNPLASTPATLIDGLRIGQRVWVQRHGRRLIVMGAAKEPQSNGDLGLMAYAENASGIVTTFTSTSGAVAIPGVVISIPATDKDVWIEWGCYMSNNGSSSDSRGPFYSSMYEATGGSAVLKSTQITHKDLGMNYTTNSFARHHCSARVGPSTTSRTFGLWAQCVKEAGTTLSGTVLNLSSGPSWIAAVAR